MLLVSLPGAVVMHARLLDWAYPPAAVWLDAAFVRCMTAAGIHPVALVTPRLRAATASGGSPSLPAP